MSTFGSYFNKKIEPQNYFSRFRNYFVKTCQDLSGYSCILFSEEGKPIGFSFSADSLSDFVVAVKAKNNCEDCKKTDSVQFFFVCP